MLRRCGDRCVKYSRQTVNRLSDGLGNGLGGLGCTQGSSASIFGECDGPGNGPSLAFLHIGRLGAGRLLDRDGGRLC